MSEFTDQIRSRVRQALDDLADAQQLGDEYRVRIHTGELESFARLAAEHGVTLNELAPYHAA